MTLALLLASAIRSAVLGTIVWLALKTFRLRDSGTQTIVWTVVLVACLLMPLMARAVPTAIHLPALWPVLPTMDQPVLRAAVVSGGHIVDPSQGPVWRGLGWVIAHWQLLLWCGYGLVVAAGLARLLVGIVSTVRLYRASIPIKAPWTENRHVRICDRITGPVSCGSCIILPENYRDWSAKKLAAVLAHEQAHLDRGDFFIQLLAALHRILFWFSPFAWWLQIRLAFLAEAASDEAAVRVLNDRAYYAEVLLEMSRKAQGVPLLVAMTKRGGVQQRILQILDDALPASAPSASARAMLVVAVLPLAGLLAGARANVPLDVRVSGSAAHLLQSRLVVAPTIEVSPRIVAGPLDTRFEPVRRTKVQSPEARQQAAAPETVAVAAPVPDKDEASYNPRALLQGSGVAVVSTIIVVAPDDQQKTNRSAPALLDLRSGDHDSQ